MAGASSVSMSTTVSGLGSSHTIANTFTGTVPTAVTAQYVTQTTTDTAQALSLGNVSTVEGILIKAVTKALDIDTSYVSSFAAEILLAEGQSTYFKPNGTVYVKNHTAEEVCVFEYIVYGTKPA